MSFSNRMDKYGSCIEEYEIKELLGKGGFAKVYRARCLRSGLEIAIKMIDKKHMQEAGMNERVNQEIIIHSRLNHPSILRFHTYFQDEQNIYLVLELCHNGELQRYLKTTKSYLSETETSSILRHVVDGLLYLHSNNIVHRDMSLANLLLTNNMDIKICDFGLATRIRPNEKHMTMCGTPNYISPEVATSSVHGFETDVWGVGVMLFTMLVGKPPFDDDDGVRSTLTRVVMSEANIPQNLSNEARDLIRRLLQKNPKHRIKLEDVLRHSFMTKSSIYYRPVSAASNRTDSSKRWSSYDSGVASSYQPSSLSIPVSQPLPVLNGAHRKLTESRSSITPCCNGHLPNSNRRDDCSHCNPTTDYGHVCYSNSVHRCHQLPTSVLPLPSAPKIPIPPINSQRLQPVRQKTKNVIVNILENGEVCLEFTKYKEGCERVCEVLRISPDGMRIVLYQPNHGKGVLPGSSPPSLPSDGANFIYSYENIPEKHWKKYSYAAKFVDLVKTKTPKVTYYSKSAKCFLMENSPDHDFEACFYEGGKITKSGSGVKLIESNGVSFNFDMKTSPHLSPSAQLMWEHFGKCLKHCQKIESTMEILRQDSEDACFPVIVGRRPPEYTRVLQSSNSNNNKENLSPTAPSIVNVRTIGGYEASVISASSKAGSNSSKNKRIMRECNIPGGKAVQFSNGDINLKYSDGTTLLYNRNSANVSFTDSNGNTFQYKQNDPIPKEVKQKLSHMPEVLLALMASSSN